jgi:hypothetical protein
MLCEYCGNLEGSPNNEVYCPAKMRALRDRLALEDGSEQGSDTADASADSR